MEDTRKAAVTMYGLYKKGLANRLGILKESSAYKELSDMRTAKQLDAETQKLEECSKSLLV